MQAFLKVSFKPGEGVPMEGSPNLLGRNLVKYGDCRASRCRLFMPAVENDGVVAIFMVAGGVTQKQNMNFAPRHHRAAILCRNGVLATMIILLEYDDIATSEERGDIMGEAEASFFAEQHQRGRQDRSS